MIREKTRRAASGDLALVVLPVLSGLCAWWMIRSIIAGSLYS